MRVNNGYSHVNLRTIRSYIKQDAAEGSDDEDSMVGFIPEEQEDQRRVILLNDYIHLNRKNLGTRKGGACPLKKIDVEDPTLMAKSFSIERSITQIGNSNRFETRRDNNQQACCEQNLDCKKLEVTDNVRTVTEDACIEERCAEIQFSRLKSMPSGSISVVCQKSRVAMLVLWSVTFPSNNRAGFNIQVAPIINFLCDSEMLIGIAKYIGMALMEKFICHHGDFNDCKNQTEALQLFDELSQFILSIKTDIAIMLTEKMDVCSARNNGNRFTKTIQRALNLSNTAPGISIDHLDIYKIIEMAEVEVIHRAKKDLYCNLKGEDDMSHCPSHCPICFDIFDGDQMSLAACNHQVCASCWRGLLRSAASSGEGIIKCPYFHCSNILGIREIAHIMFDDLYATSDTVDILSSAQILMKLVRFQIEQYLSTRTTNTEEAANFRFCPTPSCERVFSFTKKSKKDRQSLLLSGSDIVVCTCGTSMCADCKGKGSSHLGLTCEEYKKVRKEIDSGRMDDEYKSLQWMNRNTEPCPKCNFLISKNGGCNHMRCTKCSHYFCWICKRPGNLCHFYNCRASMDQRDGSSVRGDIMDGNKETYQIQQFRALTIAEERYHDILKRGALMHNKDIELQIQLRHISVWARAYLAIHSENSKWSCAKLENAVKSLEQILCVISIKNDENPELTKPLFDKGCLSTMYDSYADESFKNEPLNTKLTTRKIQALNQISKKRSENKDFSAQLQVPKLSFSDFVDISKLSSMSVRRFNANAVSKMCGTIEQLNRKHERRRRMATENYTDALIRGGSVINLNKKAKPLIASWKNKQLPSTRDKGTINKPTRKRRSDTESAVKRGRLRWKGKHRLKVRRSLALAQDI
mmetsp:Transcript_31124/g.61621  ORF Transcript_31124/g.61621 Transcript_31124/m.61621 type:complete len:864 (-) Transcript_31124:91-2682(-)